MVRRLATNFKNFVPEEKLDQLENEFCLYQTSKDLPDVCHLDVDVYLWGAKCLKTFCRLSIYISPGNIAYYRELYILPMNLYSSHEYTSTRTGDMHSHREYRYHPVICIVTGNIDITR